MTITRNLVSADAVTAYVESRGYRTEPMEHDGRVGGLWIKGPRGLSYFLMADQNLFDESKAKLECDSFDYASKRVEERKMERLSKRMLADRVG